MGHSYTYRIPYTYANHYSNPNINPNPNINSTANRYSYSNRSDYTCTYHHPGAYIRCYTTCGNSSADNNACAHSIAKANIYPFAYTKTYPYT